MITLMLALKLTVVFALAGLATMALRHGRAAARHLIWGLALAGAMALPFLGAVSPRVELALLPAETTVSAAAERSSLEAPAEPAQTSPATSASPVSVNASANTPAPTSQDAETPTRTSIASLAALPWLFIAWGAGSLLFALLVLASVIATARLGRRTSTVQTGAMLTELNACREALGVRRPVRLLLSQDQVMPMTWGALRPSILLPAAATDWTAERRRDVFLHELAHVRRLDWLSQIGARLVCAAYWWHPLAWYAATRMREERELACDDLVITQGTNPADYAHHLLAIAKDLRASPATALAGVAMARPSQLASRLLAALDATRRRSTVSRAHAGAAVAAAATVLLPIAGLTAVSANIGTAAVPPAISSTICSWQPPGESSSSHSNIDDDRVTIRITRDDCEMSIRSRGLVRFSDDERDIAELGADSWFELEERGARSARRRAEFERRNGNIVRRFYVDGREAAWDASAQEWFHAALLVVFRRTSFQAEERVARIYARGGGNAVLAEVDHIHSGSALATYLSFLGKREQLNSAQARQIATLAGERISSSSAMGRVLKTLLRNPGLDDAARSAIIASTTRISSSSERSSVLVAAVEYRPLTPALADAVLLSASEINSSSARSEVLTTVGARLPANTALPASYLEAARGISSSSALGNVLVSLLERDRLSDTDVLGVLELVNNISSSSEKARVLEAVLGKHKLTERTRGAFFRASEGISSSSAKGGVLRAVISSKPDAATVERVMDGVASVSSSSEKAEVLVAAARAGLIGTPALRAAYERAATSITSRSDRERVMRALGDRQI